MGSIDELVKELEDFAASTTIGTGALADGRADPALATTPQEQREAAQQVAEELIALQSIFGEDNVQLLQLRRRPTDAALTKSSSQRSSLHNANDATGAEEDETSWTPDVTIRLCIAFEIEANEEREEPPLVRLSATLPPCYPIGEHAPQLQLLNRYVGAHGVDHGLFGRILRVYMQGGATTAEDSVHPGLWQPGSVALFDGIERVREVVQSWHDERESERVARRLEDDAHKSQQDIISLRSPSQDENGHDIRASDSVATSSSKSMGQQIHSDLEIVSSPAITERKSIFVGHAAKINDPSQVPLVIAQLLQDRKIARATHPVIHAWVCKPDGGTIHRDCDDDGETAAGGRLAHLLDLLHLENVLVVVTRWYGGVQLGADRFKLINRAARDALEVAGLVDGALNPGAGDKKKNTKSQKQQSGKR